VLNTKSAACQNLTNNFHPLLRKLLFIFVNIYVVSDVVGSEISFA